MKITYNHKAYSTINVFFSTILCFNDSKARKKITIIKISIHFNSGNVTSRSNDGTYEDYVTSETSLQNRRMQIDT